MKHQIRSGSSFPGLWKTVHVLAVPLEGFHNDDDDNDDDGV